MPFPISKAQSITAVAWLDKHFGKEVHAAVFQPFDKFHIYAIACQETAYFWLRYINKLPPEEIVARCVLDGSGDVAGAPRSAFPRNTEVFRQKLGDEFTDMLIEEGNKTRALRGLKPWSKIYKGYGIFQYDLQFVVPDAAFFRYKKWHDFRCCLDRCLMELRRTYAREQHIKRAIMRYNGSGPRARAYADNVMSYYAWIKAAI